MQNYQNLTGNTREDPPLAEVLSFLSSFLLSSVFSGDPPLILFALFSAMLAILLFHLLLPYMDILGKNKPEGSYKRQVVWTIFISTYNFSIIFFGISKTVIDFIR